MRTEQHQIKPNHPFYEECDRLCAASKSLYNKMLFEYRQVYFHNEKVHKEGKGEKKEYLSWVESCNKEKHTPEFEAMAAGVSQQVIRTTHRNWKSFFAALKEYRKNPEKFKARPKPPYYKHAITGRFVVVYDNARATLKGDGTLKLIRTKMQPVFMNRDNCQRLAEVRIVPRNGYYVIEIVYEEKPTGVLPLGDRVCAIDPGLNNLMTGVATGVKNAFILNGRPLKSINAYYNKQMAKAKSQLPVGVKTSKHIQRLWRRRENKIKDYCHKATTKLVDLLYKKQVGTIIIGHNEGQKQEINLGTKTNQNFVMLPRLLINSMMKYKAEAVGMTYLETEESFTSKASALDNDFLPSLKEGKPEGWQPSGKRVKRGLYRTGGGYYLNADVNGALNILRKVVRKELDSDWIKGFLVTPVRRVDVGF